MRDVVVVWSFTKSSRAHSVAAAAQYAWGIESSWRDETSSSLRDDSLRSGRVFRKF
jgi:hypothetical protein